MTSSSAGAAARNTHAEKQKRFEGGPLQGIVVLDLTQIYNGPYATYLAAMAGARVIKVEPPGGEHLRKRSASSGAALPFALLNGNKECVTLNLKSETGRQLLLEMVDRADILVENYAPGVMQRLGVGAETLRERNPRLIYASGSGYGSTGPYKNYPAMDLTVQAMSGVMSITGMPDGPPLKAGPAICDFFGGIHLYAAIATALVDRERSGFGRHVEVSMLEAVYHSLSSSLGLLYDSPEQLGVRTGNRHGGLSLCPYNVYPTADGYIAIICNHEAHWQALAACIGRPGLAGAYPTMRDRVAHMADVDDIVAAWTSTRNKAELFAELIERKVPCAPIRTLAEVSDDPHLRARGMLTELQHPEFGNITVAGSPLRFLDTPRNPPRPSEKLGAANHAIYGSWLGYAAKQVDEFAEAGAI